MSTPTEDDLSLCQQEALQALRERVAIAQRRSSRTKAIVLFGRDANINGAYLDLKTEVALTLAGRGGEYVNFEEHVPKLLEAAAVAYDPLRLGATAFTNYLYRLCGETESAFLVVDRLHAVLRFLCEGPDQATSGQNALLRSLLHVMFPKPVVLALPLFPDDRRWLSREAITQALDSKWKWVYLEETEIDMAFLRERIAGPGASQDEGGSQ